jgi:hypothetical protein
MAFLIASAGNDYLFSSDVGGVKNKPMSTDHRTDAPRRLPRLHLRASYDGAVSSPARLVDGFHCGLAMLSFGLRAQSQSS